MFLTNSRLVTNSEFRTFLIVLKIVLTTTKQSFDKSENFRIREWEFVFGETM